MLVLISMLLGLVSSASAASISSPGSVPAKDVSSISSLVVRVYFVSKADLDSLAARYDILDVNNVQEYATVILSTEEYTLLQHTGYQVEIDQAKTALLNQPFVPLPGQGTDSIPGYPCYRTVEETYTTIQDIANNNPGMAEFHARELVTAETATRYAELLITNYGIDPDTTWLLDYFKVYIVTMTNPD